ncbi:MAG: DNA polymerase/3'-5' exonuclease PolX [Candidatus Nanoarchaeia archaeon]
MKNQEIARIFYEIADILEMQGVNWKPVAYRKAARALESLSEDIEEIYKKGKLEDIPGVGEGLAKKIKQYIETGRIEEYERLKKTLPKGITKLMEIQGLGPKKVKTLYKKLGIKSIKDLERAAKQHKISKLPLFKEKTEENILKGLELYKRGEERTFLHFIIPVAENIVNQLKSLKEVDKAIAAGSLRRRKETVRDIDILVISKNPAKVMDFFTTMPSVRRVLAKGPTKSAVIIREGIQVDVRVVEPRSFGSALMYFTGSKDHNIALRAIAIKKGYKLSEYGLFLKKNDRMIAGKTEEEVYKKLGMAYVEPELRENMGEIDAALHKKLPKLVKESDIKGDLHIHSKYSDGSNSVLDIANYCKKLGYKYISISDHSKSQKIAHGVEEKDLMKKVEEVKKVKRQVPGIKVFCGAEVDIKVDGSLDYDDDVLKKMDLVTASVHSNFKLPRDKMTDRLIAALENPYVNILGHPTGRLIAHREAYDFDFDKILEVAKKNKKFLEINCVPDRMDLPPNLIKAAVDNGVKLAIGTDAHNLDQLSFIHEGVSLARRGWCEKKDVLNTYDLPQLVKLLGVRNAF